MKSHDSNERYFLLSMIKFLTYELPAVFLDPLTHRRQGFLFSSCCNLIHLVQWGHLGPQPIQNSTPG